MMFAQAGGGFGGGRANLDIPPDLWAVWGVVIVFVLIFVVIMLIVQIFYLLTLHRCFDRISPSNRRMEPAMVWLNLIPCFGMIWIFFTTTRLADSLRDEFSQRGLPGDGDFGRTLGITYPVLSLLGAIPYIGALFSLAGLVCWIIYWVKIAGYSRELLEGVPDRAADRGWDDRGWQEGADRV